MKLPLSFYRQDNVIQIAKNLLGKMLYTNINNVVTAGVIVETECYQANNDKASHSYNRKITKRTKSMYEAGGITYVYLCYGMYHLLNIVTNKENIPDAVLLRAIEPTHGIEHMLKRRKTDKLTPKITAGPGMLSGALGIDSNSNNLKLNGSTVWIEDANIKIEECNIIKSPRVGIAFAKEDAILPWRFRIKNNKWTSKAK